MGLWAFVLCILSLLWTGHCLGAGSLPPTWPMSPSFPCPWADWCPCHAIALFLLWYHLSFYFVVTSRLTGWSSCQSISYILSSFRLHWPAFLLSQPTPSFGLPLPISFIGLPRPIAFLGHPQPISFLGLPWPIFFFLTSFTPMGFCQILWTSPAWLSHPYLLLPFELICLYANPMNLLIHFLGFLSSFTSSLPLTILMGLLPSFLDLSWLICFFLSTNYFCGPVNHYSCWSLLYCFLSPSSSYCWAYAIGPFCQKWALTRVNLIFVENLDANM